MQTITVWLSFRPLWETDASGVLASLNKAGVCTLHTLKTIYGMVLWDSGVKWKKNLCAWGSGFREKSSSILTFDSKSTAISKTNTHPQHGILPWPEALGSSSSCLNAASLGRVLTHLTHHSGGWRFEEKSWHSVWWFTAILHGKDENYNGTNPWRLCVRERERQCFVNLKKKKAHIFPHCASIICRDANIANKEITADRETTKNRLCLWMKRRRPYPPLL